MFPRHTPLPLAAALALAALLSAGCVSNGPRSEVYRSDYGYYGHRTPVIVYSPPPPPPPPLRVEVVPLPRPGYIWTPGRWQWENDHHRWVDGRWEARREVREVSPPPPRPVIVQRELRPAQLVRDEGPRLQPSPPRPQFVVSEPRRDVASPLRGEPEHGRAREERPREERTAPPGHRQEQGRPEQKRQEPDARARPRGRDGDRPEAAGGRY